MHCDGGATRPDVQHKGFAWRSPDRYDGHLQGGVRRCILLARVLGRPGISESWSDSRAERTKVEGVLTIYATDVLMWLSGRTGSVALRPVVLAVLPAIA